MNGSTNDPMTGLPHYRVLWRLCEHKDARGRRLGAQTLSQIVAAFRSTPDGYLSEWLQALERSRLIRLVGSGLYWPTIRGQRVCREIYGTPKRRQAHG